MLKLTDASNSLVKAINESSELPDVKTHLDDFSKTPLRPGFHGLSKGLRLYELAPTQPYPASNSSRNSSSRSMAATK